MCVFTVLYYQCFETNKMLITIFFNFAIVIKSLIVQRVEILPRFQSKL